MTFINRAQVLEIDRRSIEEFHIPGIVLMENAALAVANAACEMIGENQNAKVLILCGGGNNGGDGLAVARHLHNRGMKVTIGLMVDPSKYKGDALVQWNIITAMKLSAMPFDPTMPTHAPPVLVIDAIFGTGLSEPPRKPFSQIAAIINQAKIPVLAVDVPSGLDCDTGMVLGACIQATKTVTFVAEKVGFNRPEARQYLGEIIVGSIGCPRELLEEI